MRSEVVLPQPDGPTRTMNSPSWISQVEVVDGDDLPELLPDAVERDGGHAHASSADDGRGSLHLPDHVACWTDPVRRANGAGIVANALAGRPTQGRAQIRTWSRVVAPRGGSAPARTPSGPP